MEEGAQDSERLENGSSTVGSGETLGEAKWAAMKELEPRFPGITADSVRFSVVNEPTPAGGPARVEAEVDVEAWRERADQVPDEPGERVRAVAGRAALALALRGRKGRPCPWLAGDGRHRGDRGRDSRDRQRR